MGRYGASFRLYFRQQIWATNPYLRQQIYNKFNQNINTIANKYEIFSEELIAIMYRQLIPKNPEIKEDSFKSRLG